MTAATVDISYVSDKVDYGAQNPLGNDTNFERFIKSLLVTEPLYASRLERVWMLSDRPDWGNRPGHGIGSVAQERDTGGLVAVQCEFFSPKAELPKGEIKWFLGESGKHPFRLRLLVTTAGRPNSAADGSIRSRAMSSDWRRSSARRFSVHARHWSGSSTATRSIRTSPPASSMGPVVTGHR